MSVHDEDYDPSTHADDSIEDDWDVLTRCWDQLRNVCLAVARGDETEADEMMGEVVDRMPAIYDKWDPCFGVPLRAYVFMTVRRYMQKRVARAQQRVGRTLPLEAWAGDNVDEGAPSREASRVEFDRVVSMVRAVDSTMADVLVYRYRLGWSYADIGAAESVSKARASEMCARAFEMARRLCKEEQREEARRDEMRERYNERRNRRS